MMRGIASLVEGRGTIKNPAFHGNPHVPGVWHLVGAALGGLALAASMWLLASPIRTILPVFGVLAALLPVCAAAIAFDLHWLALPHRLRRGQVPVQWLSRYGLSRGYFLYGLSLGAGIFTFVPFALTFVAFSASALLAPFSGAVAAGAAFGVGRAALVAPLAHNRTAIRHTDTMLIIGSRWFPYLSATTSLVLAIVVVGHAWALA